MPDRTASLGKRLKTLMFQAETAILDDQQYQKGCDSPIEVVPGGNDHKPQDAELLVVQTHHPKSSLYLSDELITTESSNGLYRCSGPGSPENKNTRGLHPYLPHLWINRNRALSIRSKSTKTNEGSSGRKGFSLQSLRANIEPELSRKLYKVIKSSNNLISAHDTAAKERTVIGTQLSEWGEQTQDESVSDISDKVGVLLSELGDQEESYAHNLDDSRGILKSIRNTEKSVQPSRDNKAKIADEIQKLKIKEPQSTKLVVLEQELVRAEAENMVAEAQLSNVTRQKFKEAYAAEFAAVIERAERQIILAKHGRRLITLLDDSPITPGDAPRQYTNGGEARQILNDAEDDLRNWELRLDDEPESFHEAQPELQHEVRETSLESSVATGHVHGAQEPGLGESSYTTEAHEPRVAGPALGVET